MTEILLDPAGLDGTSVLLEQASGEYEMTGVKLQADADPWSMPPEVGAYVQETVSAIGSNLRA